MTEPAEIRKLILKETRAIRGQVSDRVDRFADSGERKTGSEKR